MRRNKYIYHILGCLVFLVLPMLLAPRPPEEPNGFFTPPTVRDLLANILMLGTFYLNYYVLIDRFYFKKKYLFYAIIVSMGFVLIIVFPTLLTGGHFTNDASIPVVLPNYLSQEQVPEKPDNSFLQEVGHHIYLFAAVILFSILLQVNDRLLRSDKERIAAELAHLKAQIHPHFLFNTLNSIYALTIRKDDSAPDSIVKLSEFMRYLLKDANENEVALSKELDYISNYLDLQVSRLRDSVKLEYELIGQPGSKKISPLLLFSFIENAFKHGVNPEQDSQIQIRITIAGASVSMFVKNKIVEIRRRESSTNIGLANSKERLNLYYPGRHDLEITKDQHFFTINLHIDLI